MSGKLINAEYGLHCISLSFHVIQDFKSTSGIIIVKAYMEVTFVLIFLHQLSTQCRQN